MSQIYYSQKIVKRLFQMGEGAEVTFELQEEISIPTEPFNGISHAVEDTEHTTITGELAMVDGCVQNGVIFFAPNDEEKERIGLNVAANHEEADSGQMLLHLDICWNPDDGSRPYLSMVVPTGGKRAQRYSGDVSDAPPEHEIGRIQAVYPS